MGEFFEMGGYGFYVWTSYALFAIVFVGNVLVAWRRERAFLNSLSRKVRRKQNELYHSDAQA
ncbi:heme exporter protein CcmD [Thioflexithrix psekupsensis]|uniref:Heme exporter protein D n=1 Tax=Thioflexithrix psekupsensis TaxID=1570016 RepID=A0A251X6A7_9GAMM|nr:heme exporter protein CcmD [Thioflexithrix psekupsensis]OUD13193.1 heme exporter protein CcmD [Thioflexithrix psekupsensis]